MQASADPRPFWHPHRLGTGWCHGADDRLVLEQHGEGHPPLASEFSTSRSSGTWLPSTGTHSVRSTSLRRPGTTAPVRTSTSRCTTSARCRMTSSSLIVYKHCYIAGGYMQSTIDDGEPIGYRLHQWQSSDAGVLGRSSALDGARKTTAEDGLVWVEHCIQEIGNWAVFLTPALRPVQGHHQHRVQPVHRPDPRETGRGGQVQIH